MWQLLRNNPLALVLAILFHLGLIAFLVIGVDWKQKPARHKGDGQVIQARVVTPAPRPAASQQEAVRERQRRLAVEREQQAAAEQKRKAEAERKRKLATEQKRKAEAERKRKLAAERKRKAEAERKRKLAAERKRKAEAERKRKLAAERKRKAEAERKRKLAAEKKRKAEEAARRAAEERAMQQALEAEIAGELNARELNRYIGLIQKRITRAWIRPPGSARGLRCTVRVRLVGNGTIVPGSVRIVHGSGNSAFDRSVVQAVYKAEPLPLPEEPTLRARFNELELIFDPDKG